MRKWGAISLMAMFLLAACNNDNDNAQPNTPLNNAERDLEQFGDEVERGIDDLGDGVERGIENGDIDRNGMNNQRQNNGNGGNNGQGTNQNGTTNNGDNELFDEIAPNDNAEAERDRQLNEGR